MRFVPPYGWFGNYGVGFHSVTSILNLMNWSIWWWWYYMQVWEGKDMSIVQGLGETCRPEIIWGWINQFIFPVILKKLIVANWRRPGSFPALKALKIFFLEAAVSPDHHQSSHSHGEIQLYPPSNCPLGDCSYDIISHI